MFERIFSKKRNVVIAICIAAVLFVLYLCALLRSGVWCGDTFLYKQKNGSFSGSDYYADYEMYIEKTNEKAQITFSVNDETRVYTIEYSGAHDAKIFENDALIFEGEAIKINGEYFLNDKNKNLEPVSVNVVAGRYVPTNDDLFPSARSLYSWAEGERDLRGNLVMFFIVILAIAFLALDIVFPDLFFILEYSLAVDGGEPSDWYRMGQVIGRFILGITIIIFVALSFVKG